MRTLKKLSRLLLAALMAALLAFQLPVSVLAASRTYLSDLVIECGSSADAVKQKLTAAGYTVYDVNLSTVTAERNNKNGGKCYEYMYLGYKVTTDPKDAITDIRAMNMGGGYSEAEYKELLKQKKEEIGDLIDSLSAAVEEYRANYAKGLDCAKYGYSILNMMIEDDSNTKMGDWLLDPAKTRDDYIRVFTQCNSLVFLTVAKALATACALPEGEGLVAIAGLDPADFAGEVQYEETADAIFAGLPALRAALEPFLTSGFYDTDGYAEEDIQEEFQDRDAVGRFEWTTSFPLAAALAGVELDSGDTLLDLLLSDPDELTTEDFYPLASLLTPGQAAIVRYAGLQTVLSTSLVPQEDWDSLDDYVDVDETICLSVYAGVNRELFEGGVALTSKALVEAASSNDNSWFVGNLDEETEQIFYKIMWISMSVCFGSVLLYLVANKWMNAFGSTISKMMLDNSVTEALNLAVGHGAAEAALAADYMADLAYYEQMQLYGLYVSQVMTYLGYIALGAALIAGAVYLFAEGYAYYHPDYEDIPRMLVSKEYDNDGNTVFVNYRSVRDLSGVTVDYEQYFGHKWVALYTTKDVNAGTPILESLTSSHENYLADYLGVRKFSQDTAYDLMQYSFDEIDKYDERSGRFIEDKNSPHYLFFKPSKDAGISASVFADAGNIVLAAGAFLIGAVAGGAIAVFAMRRKGKKNPETGETQME